MYTTADLVVSKLFRAYGLYNVIALTCVSMAHIVSKLFRAYGLYNELPFNVESFDIEGFKALSSLWVI